MSGWQPAPSGYGIEPRGPAGPPGGPRGAPGGSYPALRQALSTLDGFERSIRFRTGADLAAGAILGAAGALLLWNVVNTTLALVRDGLHGAGPVRAFLDVFVSTRGENPGMLYAIVWGPVVLVPLAVAVWALRRLTRRGRLERTFQRYQQAGFLGTPVRSPVEVPAANNARAAVFVVADPRVPPEWAGACASHLAALVNTDPRSPDATALVGALTRTNGGASATSAVRAAAVDARFPDGLWFLTVRAAATPAYQGGRPLVFVPGTGQTAAVYALRDDLAVAR